MVTCREQTSWRWHYKWSEGSTELLFGGQSRWNLIQRLHLPLKSFTQSITSPIILIFCFSLKIKCYAWPTCLFQAGRAECGIILDFLFIDIITTTTHWYNSKLVLRLHLLLDSNHQSASYLHEKWLTSIKINYLIFWTLKIMHLLK